MITVRKNTFETNSSSTHSIVIPKKVKYTMNHINFYVGEYGWATGYADSASYFYTAILELEKYGYREGLLDKLKLILDRNGITYNFRPPVGGEFYYIDHVEDLCGFVDKCLEDDDYLIRFLSAGDVYTGNDNNMYEEENPDRLLAYNKPDPDNYEYYYKSN